MLFKFLITEMGVGAPWEVSLQASPRSLVRKFYLMVEENAEREKVS